MIYSHYFIKMLFTIMVVIRSKKSAVLEIITKQQLIFSCFTKQNDLLFESAKNII